MRTFALSALIASSIAIASPAVSQQLPESMKLCGLHAVGHWRTFVPVPNTWTMNDCAALATGLSSHVDVSCIFAKVPSGGTQKFSLGKTWDLTINPGDEHKPNPNCGWN